MKKYFPKIFGNTDTKMRLSDAIIDKDIEDGDRVTVYVDEDEIQYFKD